MLKAILAEIHGVEKRSLTEFSAKKTVIKIMKIKLGILLLIISIHQLTFGQSNRIGLELTTNIPFWAETAGNLPKGINLFAQIKHHELYVGIDIIGPYSVKILGFEGGYKYHFNNQNSKRHLYLDFNNQWCRWGSGFAMNVPYNYSEFAALNIWHNTTFISSLLIGYEWHPLKWLSLFPSIGPGINFYHLTGPSRYLGASDIDDKKIAGVLTFKLGIRIFYETKP